MTFNWSPDRKLVDTPGLWPKTGSKLPEAECAAPEDKDSCQASEGVLSSCACHLLRASVVSLVVLSCCCLPSKRRLVLTFGKLSVVFGQILQAHNTGLHVARPL